MQTPRVEKDGLKRRHGWRLHITKRRQRAFKVVGLTWIVERTFAWLARNRRLSKDYELKVQTSEAFIDLAAIRLMLKRLDYAPLARLQRLEQAFSVAAQS